MASHTLGRRACRSCGHYIDVPPDTEQFEVECPDCRRSSTNSNAASDTRPCASEKKTGPLTPEQIKDAFYARVRASRKSPFHVLGLMVAGLVMTLLPLIYFGLILLAGYGTYSAAARFEWLLADSAAAPTVFLIKGAFYVASLISGIVLVLFMVKPFLAKRLPQPQALSLNPEAEPLLAAFIWRICDEIGAPRPTRIDLDCRLNASAGFRNGFSSFLGNDLVLTIGLPMVAALDLRQFAGVIAHEFGHFAQGLDMRLSYLVRRIHLWLVRSVYERDSWDAALDRWAQSDSLSVCLAVNLARLAVGCSRLILRGLMYLGHLISSFLLRQMEYDADRYEIAVAGSRGFEQTMFRVHLMSHAMVQAYESLKAAWDQHRALPEDFTAYLLQHHNAIPETEKTRIEQRLSSAATGLFDSHPSDADRVRRALKLDHPALMNLEGPATRLFSDFHALSCDVTLLHYQNDLGVTNVSSCLRSDGLQPP